MSTSMATSSRSGVIHNRPPANDGDRAGDVASALLDDLDGRGHGHEGDAPGLEDVLRKIRFVDGAASAKHLGVEPGRSQVLAGVAGAVEAGHEPDAGDDPGS
jgi:hypothetical protein